MLSNLQNVNTHEIIYMCTLLLNIDKNDNIEKYLPYINDIVNYDSNIFL
jgi:hypothetical protein